MNSWLFLSLLLAHVIADFYLQNDKYCSQKEEKKFRSCFLYVHSLLVAAVSWALVPVSDFGFYALAIALSHLAIYLVKAYCPKGLWSFALDQAAHLAILAAVASEFDITTELPLQFVDYTGNFSMPLFILAVLLCIKPANVLIKLVLNRFYHSRKIHIEVQGYGYSKNRICPCRNISKFRNRFALRTDGSITGWKSCKRNTTRLSGNIMHCLPRTKS